MLLKISLCVLLVLAPASSQSSKSCERQSETIISKLLAEVGVLEKGFLELSAHTKEIVWSTMRMEMRMNLLRAEMESFRKEFSTASAGGSLSVSSPEMMLGSNGAAVESSSKGQSPVVPVPPPANSCNLQQLLQQQFGDAALVINITPIKNGSSTVSPTTTADVKVPDEPEEIWSCSEAPKTGIYQLMFSGNVTVNVLCDAEYDKGGWVVIQHRFNGSEDFFRTWAEYEKGFGSLASEFWLGNEKIYKLTAEKPREIVFLMEDFEGGKAVAKYGSFKLGDGSEKYTLKSLGLFSGNAGDSLSRNVGSKFSAKDMDLDKSSASCAQLYFGGWWYDDCHLGNLNGKYLKGTSSAYATAMCWSTYKGYYYSLKTSRIMVRY